MPEHLPDVNRTPPCVNDRIRALMTRIRVQQAPDLEETYPEVWPGRVDIVTRAKRCSRTVIHPFGDSKNPFDAEAVAQKFRRLVGARLGAQAVEEVLGQIQAEVSPVIWRATLPFHR
jgi:2-methylcitrate dehydratase PrpD